MISFDSFHSSFRAAASLFMKWTLEESGPDSLILIFPWASVRSQEEHLAEFNEWFTASAQKVVVPSVEILLENPEKYEELLSHLSHCHGGYFVGGDQNRIADLFMSKPELKRLIQRRHEDGVAFAGTSAGAAIMSHIMLTGELYPRQAPIADEDDTGVPSGAWDFIQGSRVETREGLGLVKRIIIDQHFLKRSRFNRLLSVMAHSSHTHLTNPPSPSSLPLDESVDWAVGVDEDAALAITDDWFLQLLADPPSSDSSPTPSSPLPSSQLGRAIVLRRESGSPFDFKLRVLTRENGSEPMDLREF